MLSTFSSSSEPSSLPPPSSIYSLCKTGNLEAIQTHFQSSSNPSPSLHEPDEYGNTMLYYACLCGRLGVVRYLSELGARDDRYKRCFLNALNLEVRRMLKLYNVYHQEPQEKKTSSQTLPSEEEDDEDHLIQLLKKYAKKCVHENKRENKEDENSSSGFTSSSSSLEPLIKKFSYQ
ncbi:hypothetical protein FDP41_009872 [Naegleria fowleri]|uniref:Uncharacterized protein n=1 Tax=Naegleria fowleri TaxID=5763 RepID=A0A6A5BF26_NAEFO|nr:uncharacterized protein FDP41_009872 [Naegleria fowleri]KAF0971649.1 hypothetical protein FDP41_009872 [Naegleria fowleri]CAG4716595.1 unnamed protein product [Naegleria fowleri]